jgi:hypothetical protein
VQIFSTLLGCAYGAWLKNAGIFERGNEQYHVKKLKELCRALAVNKTNFEGTQHAFAVAQAWLNLLI